MRDSQRECSNCRNTIPFICKLCQTEIVKQCLACHRNNQHQGRYFDLAVKCPHCGKLTKAPTSEQWKVFVWSKVFRLPPQKVIDGSVLTNPNSVRAMINAMPRLCNYCQDRLFPPIQELRILLYLDGAFSQNIWDEIQFKPTQEQTARYFAKTKYEVRKIHREVQNLYGETIWRFTRQGRLKSCSGCGRPASPRHPIAGYSWQRGNHDNSKEW